MLDGDWRGYYAYSYDPGEHYGVSARISWSGNKFVGRMVEDRTELRRSLVEIIAELRDSEPEGDLAEWTAFLEQYPDASYVTTIPPHSVLRGEVHGHQVTFVKRYLEGQEMRWVATGYDQLEWRLEPSEIDYAGILCDDMTAMEGTWHVPARIDASGIPLMAFDGTWRLQRV